MPADAVERALESAAASGLSIMCFVGNRGMIQIHTGPVRQLRRTGPWYNVLDPKFNLHLDTTAIASSWVVNKPTSDGWVTSLELYAANGDLIASSSASASRQARAARLARADERPVRRAAGRMRTCR